LQLEKQWSGRDITKDGILINSNDSQPEKQDFSID
jgi:hypothetical protein